MARVDLSHEELLAYRPDVAEPDDFDEFWDATLAETRAHDLDVRVTAVDTPFTTVDIADVSFAGFGGDRISAWLTTPAGAAGPLPTVVQYVGYGGGRDLAGASLHFASAGFAHLLMDTRGQGSVWGTGGVTADPHGSGPQVPGVMTKGIESPETYYYRRLFTDAVRAVEAARSLDVVDSAKVVAHGGSQGGGITLAVAGLVPDLAGAMPDVPFLCNFRRAVDVCMRDPYLELTRYLSIHRGRGEAVFHTLSYFDGVNFSRRAKAPALFSIAEMDAVCPPSTCYSAYNHYTAEKRLVVYPYNDHEGGAYEQTLRQLEWMKTRMG